MDELSQRSVGRMLLARGLDIYVDKQALAMLAELFSLGNCETFFDYHHSFNLASVKILRQSSGSSLIGERIKINVFDIAAAARNYTELSSDLLSYSLSSQSVTKTHDNDPLSTTTIKQPCRDYMPVLPSFYSFKKTTV